MWKTKIFFKSCFAVSRTERFSLTAKGMLAMTSISSMLQPDPSASAFITEAFLLKDASVYGMHGSQPWHISPMILNSFVDVNAPMKMGGWGFWIGSKERWARFRGDSAPRNS